MIQFFKHWIEQTWDDEAMIHKVWIDRVSWILVIAAGLKIAFIIISSLHK